MQKKSIESNKDKLMSKKKLKAEIREKGITLVALVITIIVLLILAGITINSVIGSKGILNNAKKATNAYNKSATEENEVLDYYANEIEKASTGKGSSESTTLPAPTSTNYTGYYADVDDNGSVDGVIFVDLAKGASGNWNPGNNSWAASNNTGVYSYSAVTSGLRSYKISTKISSYSGKFGTKPVIAPNGESGNSRFYVMALSDYDTSTHPWSVARYKTQTVGSVTFRLPSKEEWAAFGGQLGINTSNYSSSYGLIYWYWSSTEYDSSSAWNVYFGSGYVNFDSKTYGGYVRLCATF